MQSIPNLTVASLAAVKQLDAEWLRQEFWIDDARWYSESAVRIPYHDGDGQYLFDRFRLSDGSMRYPWGTVPWLYGVNRLAHSPHDALVIVVEGESDVWAAATIGIMAVGVPGVSSWRAEFALPLAGFGHLMLWEESDRAGEILVRKLARDLPHAACVRGDEAIKDLGALRLATGERFADVLRERLRWAVPIRQRLASLIARDTSPSPRRRARSEAVVYPSGRGEIERARARDIEAVMAECNVPVRRGRAECPFKSQFRGYFPSFIDDAQHFLNDRNMEHRGQRGVTLVLPFFGPFARTVPKR